ncbi:MAG: hypothetical protein HYU64_10215 [Armatimonadetes bacterium]|nr:hypothetical protein [Armatimonadota bacterium]
MIFQWLHEDGQCPKLLDVSPAIGLLQAQPEEPLTIAMLGMEVGVEFQDQAPVDPLDLQALPGAQEAPQAAPGVLHLPSKTIHF